MNVLNNAVEGCQILNIKMKGYQLKSELPINN